jgi:hypothetical protein
MRKTGDKNLKDNMHNKSRSLVMTHMLVGACEALEDDLRALDLPPCGTPWETRRNALVGWPFVGNSNSNKVAVPNFASDPVPTPDFGPFASGYHPFIG